MSHKRTGLGLTEDETCGRIESGHIRSDQISAALTFVLLPATRDVISLLINSPGQHGQGTQRLFPLSGQATTRRDKGDGRAWVASARRCPSKRRAARCMHAECASPPRHLWKQAAGCSAELPIGARARRLRIIPGVQDSIIARMTSQACISSGPADDDLACAASHSIGE